MDGQPPDESRRENASHPHPHPHPQEDALCVCMQQEKQPEGETNSYSSCREEKSANEKAPLSPRISLASTGMSQGPPMTAVNLGVAKST
jgi:hypothetical protein